MKKNSGHYPFGYTRQAEAQVLNDSIPGPQPNSSKRDRTKFIRIPLD
jgi:hypothetical protein